MNKQRAREVIFDLLRRFQENYRSLNTSDTKYLNKLHAEVLIEIITALKMAAEALEK